MTTNYSLTVEAFDLHDGETSIHFKVDPDLYVGVDRALGNDPARRGRPCAQQAALVLIELGIDGNKVHRVRVERTGNSPGPDDDPQWYEDAFNYNRDEASASIVEDAVTALQAVLAQILVMRTPEQVTAFERAAYELGAEGHNIGGED